MTKIKNWSKIQGTDSWRNDESGVVVEVAELSTYGGNEGFYGFGFYDPRINKFRGLDGGFLSEDKSQTMRGAIKWLREHIYIEKRW